MGNRAAAVLASMPLRRRQVALAREPDFRLADLVVRPSLLEVRSDLTSIGVEPRVMQVLVALAQARGQTVGRSELIERCWSGRVVGDNSINRVISHIRRLAAVPGAGCFAIETVRRVGYRLCVGARPPAGASGRTASDRLHESNAGGARLPTARATPTVRTRTDARMPAPLARRRTRNAATTGAAARGAATGRQACGRGAAAAPTVEGVALVVLPFKTLTRSRRDEQLGIGVAESLIVRLSTLHWLAVRTPDVALRSRRADRDPLLAARECGAAWIVDGSLQRDGRRLRMAARLLRAADGVAAWSGSLDLESAGAFELQDRITDCLMRALAPVLHAQRGAGARQRRS